MHSLPDSQKKPEEKHTRAQHQEHHTEYDPGTFPHSDIQKHAFPAVQTDHGNLNQPFSIKAAEYDGYLFSGIFPAKPCHTKVVSQHTVKCPCLLFHIPVS